MAAGSDRFGTARRRVMGLNHAAWAGEPGAVTDTVDVLAVRCRAGAKAVHRGWNSTARTRPRGKTRGSASDGRGRNTRTQHEDATRGRAGEHHLATRYAAKRAKTTHENRPHGEISTPPGRRISPQDRPRAESRPIGASVRAVPTHPRTASRRVFPALNEGAFEGAITVLSPTPARRAAADVARRR